VAFVILGVAAAAFTAWVRWRQPEPAPATHKVELRVRGEGRLTQVNYVDDHGQNGVVRDVDPPWVRSLGAVRAGSWVSVSAVSEAPNVTCEIVIDGTAVQALTALAAGRPCGVGYTLGG
jgi:hypothetical protein